jgi:hypothetical protein
MVSSTYYDLREVRDQLARFIEIELGYRALISESAEFPTDPDASTIENCRRRVEENADIFVLVIGDRYGSVDPASGKSVTNIEYLAARAKGIPVYSFVEKRTLFPFERWQRTPESERDALGSSLGEAELFQFIERVRGPEGVWMHGFETAADLVQRLRKQLAYLVGESIALRRQLNRNPNRALYQSLGPRSLRLAVEQRPAWEYLLFGTALNEEVEKHTDARTEFDWAIAHGSMTSVDPLDIGRVIRLKMAELAKAAENATLLMGERLATAFGLPGTSGNPQQIVFVARQLGRVYRDMIDWSATIRRIHMTDEFGPMLERAALLPRVCIERIGQFGEHVVTSVEEALLASMSQEPGAPPRSLSLELTFALEDGLVEEVTTLLDRATDAYIRTQCAVRTG